MPYKYPESALTVLPPCVLAVVRWMDERRIGATWFDGTYRFPESFRNDPNMSMRFCVRNSIDY